MNVDISKIVLALAKNRCVLTGEFKLSSGATSPYYIDLRTVPSHPELFDLVTDAYVAMVRNLRLDFDRVAGVATAGVPIATLVAHKLKKPFLYVRKEEKAHGTKSLVEGVVNAGESVLIVDDVATTGGSLLRAVDALRERGGKVENVVVLIDREQGAAENLAKEGVRLISLMTSSRLIEELHLKGMVAKGDYERVVEYIRRSGHVQRT
jgi:orotate phosphoribosyltransferase